MTVNAPPVVSAEARMRRVRSPNTRRSPPFASSAKPSGPGPMGTTYTCAHRDCSLCRCSSRQAGRKTAGPHMPGVDETEASANTRSALAPPPHASITSTVDQPLDRHRSSKAGVWTAGPGRSHPGDGGSLPISGRVRAGSCRAAEPGWRRCGRGCPRRAWRDGACARMDRLPGRRGRGVPAWCPRRPSRPAPAPCAGRGG